MTKISTWIDAESFERADNPVVQYKDALDARSSKEIDFTTEELSKVLDGSLFRLSVDELASFIKHNPLFERFDDEQKYNIMLYMSLFAQMNYSKPCLPYIEYKLGTEFGHKNAQVMKTWSYYMAQVQPQEYCDTKHASVLCKFHTFMTDHEEGMTLDQAKQVMQFYMDHYKQTDFELYDENDNEIMFIRDYGIHSIAEPDELTDNNLDENENFKIKIMYDVDVNKLPVTVHYALQDYAQKALQFAEHIEHVSETTDLEFREYLLSSLIALNNLNVRRHPKPIRENVKTICQGNKNFGRNIDSENLANLCNDLLNDLLVIGGKKPVNI